MGFLLYTRIYYSVIKGSLKSDKRLYYTLSYLKLKTIASNRAGFFSFQEAEKTLNLSSKTTQRHLRRIILDGLLVEVDGGYLLKDERKVKVFNTKLRSRSYHVMEVEGLFKYSWRNISDFRAFFSELRIEKDVKAINLVGTGFSIRPKDGGKKIRIKNEELLLLIPFYSYLRSAKTNKCSISTAIRYRKKQKMASYKHKFEKIIPFKEKPTRRFLQQQKLIESCGKVLRNEEHIPYAYSPPSVRLSNVSDRPKGVSDFQFSLSLKKKESENNRLFVQKPLPVAEFLKDNIATF